jgi:hypothetical protein
VNLASRLAKPAQARSILVRLAAIR